MKPTAMLTVTFVSLTLLGGAPSPARAAQPAETPTGSSTPDREVAALMRAFDREPSVVAVQEAAMRYAELEKPDGRGWRARARLANLVPEVGGEIAWLDQTDAELRYSEDIETQESGRMYRESAENRFVDDQRLRVVYSVDAELDLGGLIFDRDEIGAAREARHRESARRKLVARVTDLYFERRKKQILHLAAPPADWRQRLDLLIEIERLTARLDGLTGGWFRKQLAEGGRR